jgi:ATP-dependent Clp protease protease subunit
MSKELKNKKKNKKKNNKKVEPSVIPTPKPQSPPIPVPMPPMSNQNKPAGEYLRENGILFMDKEFNQDNCMPLVKAILEWNLMPKEKQPEIIHLYINSPGGLVASAWHLIDTIKQSKIPVYTYAMGMAASCGCLLLMAGEKGHRYVTQNTHVMSHVYSAGSGGKEFDLFARVKSFEQTTKNMINHYKKCTGKSEEYIRKHLLPAEDVWLTPEEAIEHGVVDHIIETY